MPIIDLLFSFEGRIGRLSFWLGSLVQTFILAIPIASHAAIAARAGGGYPPAGQLLAVWGLTLLVMVWVGLALQTKRWHDRGKSGWWWLIGMVPVIGNLWVLVELGFLPGTSGDNVYGPPPGGRDVGDDDFEADRALDHWRATAARQESTPSSPMRAPGAGAPVGAPAGARGFGRRGLT